MEFLLSPHVAMFSGVLAAIAALCLVEFVLTLLIGSGVSHAFDTMVDTHALPHTPVLDWLFVKEMPMSVAITTLLLGFGISGVAVQGLALSLFGSGLPLLIATPLALCGAILSLRGLASSFTKLKVVHSTAIDAHEFIGQVAVLLSPQATKSLSGEAKFTDRYGTTHYVMVRAKNDESFKEGDSVELLESNSGGYLARRVDK